MLLISNRSEILAIFVVLVTTACFFVLPEKIAVLIAVISTLYCWFIFYQTIHNSYMDMKDVVGPLAITVITFLLWYFLSDTLAKIFLWISIVMAGRTACNLICVQSSESVREEINHAISSTVANMQLEIEQATKQIETSILSTEEVEKKISLIRNESQQKLNILTKQLGDKEKLLTAVQKAGEKAKKDMEAKLSAYRTELLDRNKDVEKMRQEQDILIEKLQKTNEINNYPLENKQIKDKFNEALSLVEKELDIFSPWMNFNVVDLTMQDKFRRLLEKGVIIKIRYGIGELSSESSRGNNRSDSTEKVAIKLKQEFGQYRNFKMYRDNSHAKLFICDNKFYVISSFNILSFKGNYDGKDMRRELGEYSTNKKILAQYRKAYFNF